jgi:hypothetical protein
MAIAKIPNHFLKSIQLDAILLTKLRENKWDNVHKELLGDRPTLNLQTQYDYEHCFDFDLEFYFADRLPRLELAPLRENSIIDFNHNELQEIIYNILNL